MLQALVTVFFIVHIGYLRFRALDHVIEQGKLFRWHQENQLKE